jgi:hypothetical protein
MHNTKEEVILRILAQESPKSELWLRRYGEKNFRDLFIISRKWLGVFLEIFLNSRVLVGILVDRGLVLDKCRGFSAKWWVISAGDLFFNRKYHGGPGPRRMDQAARLGSIVDRSGADKRAQRCLAGAWRVGARACWCSSATVEEDELDEVVRQRQRTTAA